MTTIRLTMAQALTRYLVGQKSEVGSPIAGSTITLAVANSSTGSSPDSQQAMSRSWMIMSRNMPPERRTNSIVVPDVSGVGLEWDEKVVAAHLADNF